MSKTVVNPLRLSLSFNSHQKPRKGPHPCPHVTHKEPNPKEVGNVLKVTQKVLEPRVEPRDRLQTPALSPRP